ncbi:MAG: DinB family protein [Gemmatimonadetes bacterium]|nr:DinB family protein [Gemmatimonadota bacterium]
MRNAMVAVAIAACFTSPALAQQPKPTAPAPTAAPVMDAVRGMMQRMARNLPAAADDMPVAKFTYKPTAPQMRFGDVVVHLAEGNEFLCSSASGTQPPQEAKPSGADTSDAGWPAYAPKAIAHLRRSFEYCSTALGQMDDSNLSEQVPWFGGPNAKTSRANALMALPVDWQDHYSQMAIYLRINGILPPTARPRPRTQ